MVGTNEKEGEGFAEGKEVGNRKQDYLNHLISVSNHSNHSGLFLLERRKKGGLQAILFLGAFLLFCAFPIYFCCVCTATCMTGCAGYEVNMS
jgi:hypothetical protein